jgi:hypothetical protein
MNESEMNSSPSTELTDQITALRRQMIPLLLALIVVSGTLAVYLWYQSRIVTQLAVYGQTHPDFQPILKKYGIPLTNPVATNHPAAKK